jgi:hypothetical protein
MLGLIIRPVLIPNVFLVLGIFKSAKTRNEESSDDEENEDEDNLDISDQRLLQHCFEDIP